MGMHYGIMIVLAIVYTLHCVGLFGDDYYLLLVSDLYLSLNCHVVKQIMA